MDAIHAKDTAIYFDSNGFEFLQQLLTPKNYSKIFILVDNHTNEHCLPLFLSNLATNVEIEIIEIEAGEEQKNIKTCLELWEVMIELGADRRSLLINLGGGVLTDLGGFIASTFKRGIDFIHVPTTLLAMVDAAIGGKNGIDLGALKNQVGCIVPPKCILIHSEFLHTLDSRQMRSGLAEMFKHGLILDKAYWNKLKDLNSLSTNDLSHLIQQSIQLKINVVNEDMYEKGLRKILNFGHTLGHAIESFFLEQETSKQLLHGEAIAIGMILESYISWKLNLLRKEEYLEINYFLSDVFEPVHFGSNDIEKIIQLLQYDKKNEHGIVQFVLLNSIGKAISNQNVDKTLIYEAFTDYHKS